MSGNRNLMVTMGAGGIAHQYTVVAGAGSGFVGYIQSLIGSITPTGYKAQTVLRVATDSFGFNVGIGSSSPPQAYFSRVYITGPGLSGSFLSTAASFLGGFDGLWTWSTGGVMVNGQTYGLTFFE
jgi:hypothetical protein